MTDAPAIAAACRELASGGLVVYPTETVYGLGADASSPAALERLFRAKGGRRGTGVSVLVTDLAMAAPLVDGPLPEPLRRLAEAFWPGPLTLIAPASPAVAPELVGPGGGVGLRCSPDPIAAELVRRFGRPITATSANPTGRAPAADVETAHRYFGTAVGCYLDGGPRDPASASTVVEFSRGRTYLRRPGVIGRDRLAAVVPVEQ